MPNSCIAMTKRKAAWWIAWVEEVLGVKCQERTEEGLVESLRSALRAGMRPKRYDAIRAADLESRKSKYEAIYLPEAIPFGGDTPQRESSHGEE
jgi:hypothetical protein